MRATAAFRAAVVIAPDRFGKFLAPLSWWMGSCRAPGLGAACINPFFVGPAFLAAFFGTAEGTGAAFFGTALAFFGAGLDLVGLAMVLAALGAALGAAGLEAAGLEALV